MAPPASASAVPRESSTPGWGQSRRSTENSRYSDEYTIIIFVVPVIHYIFHVENPHTFKQVVSKINQLEKLEAAKAA